MEKYRTSEEDFKRHSIESAASEIQEENKMRPKSRQSNKTAITVAKTVTTSKTRTSNNRFREPNDRQKVVFDRLAEKLVTLAASLDIDEFMKVINSRSYKQNIKSKKRTSSTLVILKSDFQELLISMIKQSNQ